MLQFFGLQDLVTATTGYEDTQDEMVEGMDRFAAGLRGSMSAFLLATAASQGANGFINGVKQGLTEGAASGAAGEAAAGAAGAGASETAGKGGTAPGRGGPYGHLEDPASAGSQKGFTQSQKTKIVAENEARNGGVLRDDRTGEVLVRAKRSQKGVTPPGNEAQVDHVYP